MGKQIRVRETVNEALPPLLKIDFHPNANAVHRLIYELLAKFLSIYTSNNG
jgi:hypothetical protein